MTNFIGIDLGTTNTAIASYDGRRIEVVRSIGGMGGGADTTSSAIFIDANQQMLIGDAAYRQTPNNTDDVVTGWKRNLGTGESKEFKSAGVTHSNEWCSTELLKHVFGYLPGAVRNDPTTSVVVTVPAAFDQIKNTATVQAANDAGIANVKLMPEPVAACLAVMRENREDKKFLVYDLGGGTLDASVADFTGGSGAILAQGGVDALGGRDWDWAIVNKVLIPWLKDNYSIDEDTLGGEDLLLILRYWAEVAKIGLSQTYTRDESDDASFNLFVPAGEIKINNEKLIDKEGKEVGLSVTLTKHVFDQLVLPIIDATVSATKNVLDSNNIDAKSIDYVVFIGGPTLYLPLKERVLSALGLPEINAKVNPMTAVAVGAALYAEGLDWGSGEATAKASEVVEDANVEFPLSLEYEARVTTSKAKLLLTLDNAQFDSVKVEVRNAAFSTGKFNLNFQKEVSLTLSEDGTNSFEVHVELPNGKSLDARIIEISKQVEINGIPVNQSISVLYFDTTKNADLPHFLIRLGEQLPAKAEYTFFANKDLSQATGGAIELKLYSGEIADRVKDNGFIGTLKLESSQLSKLDKISKGDSLIFAFEIDEGLTLSSMVSVPSIGQTFVMDNITGDAIRNPTEDWQLYADEGRELKRRIEQHVQKFPNKDLEAKIPGLVDAINVVETSLVAEQVQTAAAQIKEIRKEFWNARKAGIPEQLLARHAGTVAFFKSSYDGQVESSATAAEKKTFTQASEAAKSAAEKGDEKAYEKHDDEMWDVIRSIIWRSEWWIRAELEEAKDRGSSSVSKLADEGLKALESGDNQRGAIALSQIFKKQQSRSKQGETSDAHIRI